MSTHLLGFTVTMKKRPYHRSASFADHLTATAGLQVLTAINSLILAILIADAVAIAVYYGMYGMLPTSLVVATFVLITAAAVMKIYTVAEDARLLKYFDSTQ